ncbi:splicing factor, Prp19-binding domain-containing protein [Lactarius quietus]|nr:splicing factor, Prp19-binding domain-containing protein [Lactarius quietus]
MSFALKTINISKESKEIIFGKEALAGAEMQELFEKEALIKRSQDQEVLKRHDFTETTESTVDVSLLPAVMQVKNFGKCGRTKYTHLIDQDTTVGSGGTGPVNTRGTGTDDSGCFLCECPRYSGAHSVNPGTGPNAAPKGIRDEPWSWRDDDSLRTRQT